MANFSAGSAQAKDRHPYYLLKDRETNMRFRKKLLLLFVVLLAGDAHGFSPPLAQTSQPPSTADGASSSSPTELAAAFQRFNLNREGSPFGFDLNAEVWNGRVAQVSFAWIFLQELVQGKGILPGIRERDPAALFSLNLFVLLITLLSVRFAAEPRAVAAVAEPVAKVPVPPFLRAKKADPLALRRAKTVSEVLDPNPNPEDMVMNFNDRSPYGLKKNAEIWNGRIAMLSFAWLFTQELILGGVFEGIENLEPLPTGLTVLGFSFILGFVGFYAGNYPEDDYVERVVGKDALRQNAHNPNWKPQSVEPPYEPLPDSSIQNADLSMPPTIEMYMKTLEDRAAARNAARSPPKPVRQAPRAPPVLQSVAAAPPEKYQAKTRVTYETTPAESGTRSWEQSFSDSLTAMTRSSESPPQPPAVARESFPASTTSRPPPPAVARDGFPASTTSTPPPRSSSTLYTQTTENVGKKETPKIISSVHPVPGYRFKPETQTAIGISPQDTSPHPEGKFVFGASTSEAIHMNDPVKPKTAQPISSVHPVPGYRFKPETKTAIGISPYDTSPHPKGKFVFGASTSEAIHMNDPVKSKPKTYQPIAPKGNLSPHPIQPFKFGKDRQSLIKKTDRNTSVRYPKVIADIIAKQKSIRTPSAPNVDLVLKEEEEVAIKTAPAEKGASQLFIPALGVSYLDSLNRSVGKTTEQEILIEINAGDTTVDSPKKVVQQEAIHTPSFSNVDVVSDKDGTAMNAAPAGNAVSKAYKPTVSGSYLDALGGGAGETAPETSTSYAPVATATKGGSYLEGLGSSSNSDLSKLRP